MSIVSVSSIHSQLIVSIRAVSLENINNPDEHLLQGMAVRIILVDDQGNILVQDIENPYSIATCTKDDLYFGNRYNHLNEVRKKLSGESNVL